MLDLRKQSTDILEVGVLEESFVSSNSKKLQSNFVSSKKLQSSRKIGVLEESFYLQTSFNFRG